MKNRDDKLKVNALNLAVAGALAQMFALPAHAIDDEVQALITPTNFIEIGAANVSHSSARFGEYNGMNKNGVYGVGNFSVQGGDAHDGSNGTMQWALKGRDIDQTSREFEASVSNQGTWKLGIGYDELRHNLSDSYQTPYQGTMGGNSFTLPAGFGTLANTTTMSVAQQAALRTVDIGSSRKNTSFTAAYNFNAQWDIKFDYKHLDQSGAKLMGFGSMANSSATGQAVSILPNPTDYKTDTVNMALNWVGDKGHATASYFGSFFRDGFDQVTFQTYAGANRTQTMSTAPGNNFHQLNLAGGYAFSPKTKLTGAFSYGRNTQDDAYAYDSFMMVTPSPTSSLNGVVVTTHADLKLTDQSIKNLALSAGVKYDKRDNQTSAYLYNFNAINNNAADRANYSNTPLSTEKTQLELAGDYRLSKGQNLRLAYEYSDIKRWCANYAGNAGENGAPATASSAGVNCVVATATSESKLGANYRLKATDDLSLNAGYSYADRNTDSDPNAIAAFFSKKYGTLAGQNGGDYLGYFPYFNASRTQQMFKAGVNWQAHERLSLGLNGRYTDDQYKDSTYGVQDGSSWSLNLDATFNYSENGSVFAYVTQQHRQRELLEYRGTSATNPSWNNQLKDDDTTVGLGFKQGDLMGGKLELAGDLTHSLAKTSYSTQLNSSTVACSTPATLTCGSLPDIRNSMTQFKLTGAYKIDKKSKVSLGYIYQRLNSSDYYYNGLQYGLTATSMLPTNQASGSYSVNMATVTYIYTF